MNKVRSSGQYHDWFQFFERKKKKIVSCFLSFSPSVFVYHVLLKAYAMGEGTQESFTKNWDDTEIAVQKPLDVKDFLIDASFL